MRSMIPLVLVVGCGGGSGGDNRPVVNLTDPEQVTLCERFLDDVCAHAGFESFCNDECHQTGCQAAADNGAISQECTTGSDELAITVGDVDDCATSGDFGVCAKGGGCMFDALEAVCSPPP